MTEYETWITTIEVVYHISGVILSFGVIVAVIQLYLFKKDLVDRNRRASTEKSLEYLNWFATDFIPNISKYHDRFKKIQEALLAKSKEKDRRMIREQFEQFGKNKFKINPNFYEEDVEEHYRPIIACMMFAEGHDLLNRLEFFASAMVSGLADETLAYKPLSEVYCNFIEDTYILICLSRRDNQNLYSNIVSL